MRRDRIKNVLHTLISEDMILAPMIRKLSMLKHNKLLLGSKCKIKSENIRPDAGEDLEFKTARANTKKSAHVATS